MKYRNFTYNNASCIDVPQIDVLKSGQCYDFIDSNRLIEFLDFLPKNWV